MRWDKSENLDRGERDREREIEKKERKTEKE